MINLTVMDRRTKLIIEKASHLRRNSIGGKTMIHKGETVGDRRSGNVEENQQRGGGSLETRFGDENQVCITRVH